MNFNTSYNLQFEDEAGLLILDNCDVQVLNFNAVKSLKPWEPFVHKFVLWRRGICPDRIQHNWILACKSLD